jgi:Domain of unknown function (DUF4158)
MPRRELLTPAERESLLTVPSTEAEQIRHYTLSRADIGFIRQRRWDYNRLGVAIQLCYLRYPGRVLGRGETPPATLLGMVATQIKTTAAYWDQYAARDQTRREHQQGVTSRKGPLHTLRATDRYQAGPDRGCVKTPSVAFRAENLSKYPFRNSNLCDFPRRSSSESNFSESHFGFYTPSTQSGPDASAQSVGRVA